MKTTSALVDKLVLAFEDEQRLEESKTVLDYLQESEFGGSFYHFGMGSWCKLGPLGGDELLQLFRQEEYEAPNRRLFQHDMQANNCPSHPTFLLLAQQCQAYQELLSDPDRPLIYFGGFRQNYSSLGLFIFRIIHL